MPWRNNDDAGPKAGVVASLTVLRPQLRTQRVSDIAHDRLPVGLNCQL